MSIFFEYPTDLASGAKGSLTATAWSNGEQNILAAATQNGDITLYLEEGDRMDPDVVLHRSCPCPHLQWHPRYQLLASGWEDGTIAVWGDKERVMREESVHKSAITLLVFSPEGSRLISGDNIGLLVVWAVDHRGRLQPVCKYDKKGSITHLAFRAPASMVPPMDGSVLPCPSFFFGGSSGIVVFADDLGHSSDVIKAGTPISAMHYSAAKDYLVLLTVDVVLYKYKITPDGKMLQERKVKLSIKGDGSELQACIAGAGLLAAANCENVVRLWHLEQEDNYVLSLQDAKHQAIPKDVITCIAFNPRKRVLAAGTLAGRVVFWRWVGRSAASGGGDPSADDWEVLPPVETNYGGSGSGLGIRSLRWGQGEGLLAVASKEGVSVLNETVLASKYLESAGLSMIQLSADSFSLQTDAGRIYRIQTQIRIKGFDVTEKYILVWNGKKAEVRAVPDLNAAPNAVQGDLKIVSSFATKAQTCALHNDTIYACVGSRIEILGLHGGLKNALAFTETDGVPQSLTVTGQYLACSTSHNVLKLWDIGRREPKTIVPGRHFDMEAPSKPSMASESNATDKGGEGDLHGLQIKQMRINCNGTKIALIANRVEDEASGVQTPDSRLHVYDVELDRIFSHEFGPRYYPTRCVWDGQETKLLGVETKKHALQPIENNDKKTSSKKGQEEETKENDETDGEVGDGSIDQSLALAEVTTLFATSDYGVLMQDSFAIDPASESLMALSVPHILFLSRPTNDGVVDMHGSLPRLVRRVMRDFTGLENVDEESKKDLLAFSYFLTIGNMDDAYRAVKKISSTSIWENMATMCVKTKRLDVAEVCLGNMGNARGAKAVRESKKEPEKEAQVAMLAIQLNMLEDAERLYKECGRYDLLVKLYIASGRWKEALKTASKHDRIHLKATHYQYARYLEHIGDRVNAIKHYEKSETHRHEVPRMLFDAQQMSELEQYIKASDDPQLVKWWAQYCESNGSYDEAIRYYDMAGETLALVRVYCFRGEDEKAAKVCIERNDLAACYHLARQYEQHERVEDAIHFYKLAKRYNHAIRLAKEHFLDQPLLQLSLECSDKHLKVDAATYFESKGDLDKAVMLYQKGGRIPKALDLCFKGQLFDALRSMSDSLGSDTDPALLAKCGDFFLQHQEYEKAAHQYISAKQYMKALTLCMRHNVKVTEAMAERMTPPKTKDETEKRIREDLLKKLAHVCKDQGEYHLACKKYTQAGDHVRAMKCLLKSNDTEKITYYAQMTKQPEIYILAANYLQNLDWHNDPEVMRKIIEFYSKAKAMSQLAVFYDACAQVEIDDYRDYEKALGALQDSQKFLLKGHTKDIPNREEKLASLDARIRLVQRFVEARKLVKSAPDQMIAICQQLLDAGDVESAIRVGDVYALLIEYFHSIGDFQRAYAVIERMRGANIVLSPYLDRQMVERIHAEVGAEMLPEGPGGAWDQGQMGEGDIGEEIGEEIG